MAKYAAQVLKSVTSTTVGVGALVVGQARIRLQELIVGSDAATLGTSNFRFEVRGSTSSPTGTSITPQPLDLADASSSTNVFSNLSANGTLVSGEVLLTMPLDEIVTFRWIAVPGSEIVIPATTGSGIHLMTPVCGNTPSVAAHLVWDEYLLAAA